MADDLAYNPPTFFIVDRTGAVTKVAISWQLDAAMDLLADAGMLDEKRTELLVLAERGGKNPEQLARKLVTLGAALKAARA
jgi:hypothetical protein